MKILLKSKKLDIKIEMDKIVEIGKDLPEIDCRVIELGDNAFIINGLIDMHCHLREPGYEYKETIESGIRSAKSGGFTGICPMPNSLKVNDNRRVLKYILEKAGSQIGIFPICAITKGLLGKEITNFKNLAKIGAIGFSDDGKPVLDKDIFSEALKSGYLVISHAEKETEEVKWQLEIFEYLKSKKFSPRLHFAHISLESTIKLIRNAKGQNLDVTCETAPHYIYFTKDDIDRKTGVYKMNPQLATKYDLRAVIEGLSDGTIDVIATDHAPHSIEEKLRSYEESPFGIIGFESAIGVILQKFSIEFLVEKMSSNPSRILGLKDYGEIKIGNRANLSIIERSSYVFESKECESKCKISPFDGKSFDYRAKGVVIGGKVEIFR